MPALARELRPKCSGDLPGRQRVRVGRLTDALNRQAGYRTTCHLLCVLQQNHPPLIYTKYTSTHSSSPIIRANGLDLRIYTPAISDGWMLAGPHSPSDPDISAGNSRPRRSIT